MPTYEYECTKCGHTFEAFQSMTEKPLARCPECKGALRRLIGGGLAVIFKGSGFYSTDNKRSSTLAGNGSSSKESKESKDKDGSGSKEKAKEKPKDSAAEKSAAG
jgi:putative FmdB family regulatory protein